MSAKINFIRDKEAADTDVNMSNYNFKVLSHKRIEELVNNIKRSVELEEIMEIHDLLDAFAVCNGIPEYTIEREKRRSRKNGFMKHFYR